MSDDAKNTKERAHALFEGMKGAAKPKTPELDKLNAVVSDRNTICQFLDWLQEQGMEIAAYHKHTDACEEGEVCGLSEQRLYSVNIRGETLAHQYLEIDEKKVEEERQALIESLSK